MLQADHPPVPNADEIPDVVNNSDNRVHAICQQLEKIQLKEKDGTDPRILNAIVHLLRNNNEEQIKDSLIKLQDTDLDGDTHHLINQYLNQNNN